MSSRISQKAKRSVVLVVDKQDHDHYCSGCVTKVNDNTVTVIASSKFVSGRESRLKVVFFDRTELDATVIAVEDSFCLLRTALHSGCGAISLPQDEHGVVIPQCTFMYVPQSCTNNVKMSTYAVVESLESYLNFETMLTAKSTHYFMVSCAYFDKTPSGINRLSAAPVFTMSGETAGIVLQDCRSAEPAAEMKVVLKANHLRELMMLLDPPPPPPPRKQVKKRKRAPPRKRGKKRKRTIWSTHYHERDSGAV